MKYIYLFFLFSPIIAASEDKIDDYKTIHMPYHAAFCFESKNKYELDQCVQKALNRSTTKMNNLLEKLISSDSEKEPSFIAELKLAQKEWAKHMRATCRLQTYDAKDGSGFFQFLTVV